MEICLWWVVFTSFLSFPSSSSVGRVEAVDIHLLREGVLLPWILVFVGDHLIWPECSKSRLSLALEVDFCGKSVAFAPADGCLGAPLAFMVYVFMPYLDGMCGFQNVIRGSASSWECLFTWKWDLVSPCKHMVVSRSF